MVNDELYYSLGSGAKGYPLAVLNLSSLTESLVDTGGNFQNAIEFDVRDEQTFTCNLIANNKSSNYTIDRYVCFLSSLLAPPPPPFPSCLRIGFSLDIRFDGILGQTIDGSRRQQLYNLRDAACTAIRQGMDLQE